MKNLFLSTIISLIFCFPSIGQDNSYKAKGQKSGHVISVQSDFGFITFSKVDISDAYKYFKDYNYYFQITINNYGKEFEPVIPSIDKIINLVEKLSSKIGPKRIVWRYDPIVLTKEFDLKFHIQNFEVLASKLKNNINKCVFSFLDVYLQTEENLKKYGLIIIDELKMKEIAKKLSEVAQKYNIRLETCCEKIDLSEFSISHGKCIDDKLISDIIGIDLNISKDKFQRKYCGCAESIDIGTYNTCSNVCLYCYANYNKGILRNNLNNHNPKSPLLSGDIETDDKISERKMKSYLNLKQVEFKEQKCF